MYMLRNPTIKTHLLGYLSETKKAYWQIDLLPLRNKLFFSGNALLNDWYI